MIEFLPHSNAFFNGLSALLLLGGFVAIKKGRKQLHARFMVTALVTSSLFLAGYITRLVIAGTTHYGGAGRGIYLAILASHILLAASLLVLVPLTLVRALRSRFEAHKRIARITLPIWFYVSVTGVVIYVFLYS